MEIFLATLKMIWLMLPAYLSNPAAAVSIAITGPGRPIDQGKYFRGKRIFGDGKTFKGFFFGVNFGIIVAILENLINMFFFKGSAPYFNTVAIFAMPVGALLGDLVKSFFKRRLGFERGQSFPLADQLDFVFGSWILTIISTPAWFFHNFTLTIILLCLILTPFFHLIFNIVGYKIGVSREPW